MFLPSRPLPCPRFASFILPDRGGAAMGKIML